MQKKVTQSPGVTEAAAAAGPECSRPAAAASRGQALIIVLCFIVLCTVLVIAFLGNVTTAGVGENAAASENNASQLAESAVSYVEGTITNATSPGEYPTVAWACQPGMIRTYGGSASGGSTPSPTYEFTTSAAPLAYYKLYSSNNMIVTGAAQSTLLNSSTSIFAADVPSNWDQNPAFFTDLNAPLYVTTAAGTSTVFPIVDPRAADSDIAVGGFNYGTAIVTGSNIDGIVTSGTTGTYATDTTSRLPMPVRWMYVLRNGSFTVPDTVVSGSTAQWSAAATNPPSSSNPIVGRVAFWTDDECSKVNVNTASEGTYWDTPVANSGPETGGVFSTSGTTVGDVTMAMIEPAQHEYQRYPGHPATTCLSTVFGTVLSNYVSNYGNSQGDRAQLVKSITDTIPRISDYGMDPDTNAAVAGSTPPTNSATTTLGGTVASGTSASAPYVIVDEDRLYASLDEYQFSPTYSGNTGASGTGTRVAQTFLSNASQSGSNEALNYVDTCRFFLTAHSKAPELNMFGLPRVAIWPLWDIHQQPFASTNFEKEILRCSTVNTSGTDNNPHIMAFFRYDPTSATNDFPVGTTGTGANVNRNAVVYAYLQQLLHTKVPGYGFSFSNKYGSSVTNGVNDCDQILTEIFDYIRCTNLADNSVGAKPYTSGSTGATSSSPNQAGAGQVVPIQIVPPAYSTGTSRGLGRFAAIQELGLELIKVDDRANLSELEWYGSSPTVSGTNPNLSGTVTVTGAYSMNVNPQKQTLIEWSLIPMLASPMAGYVSLADNLRIRFTNINLNIGGQPVNAGTSVALSSGSTPDLYDNGQYGGGRDNKMGGLIGPTALTVNAPTDSMYPTGLVLITGTSVTTSTSPLNMLPSPGLTGTVSVTISGTAGTYQTPGPVLQSYTFIFPPTPAPIPCLMQGGIIDSGTTWTWWGTFRAPASKYTVTPSASGTNGTFNYPVAELNNANGTRINGSGYQLAGIGDVLRTLVPTGPLVSGSNIAGDLRLLAISGSMPANTSGTTFQPSAYSMSGTPPSAVPVNVTGTTFVEGSIRWGNGVVAIPNFGFGSLYSAIGASSSVTSYKPNYGPHYSPDIPVEALGTNGPGVGDWDNGPGLMVDGPWANKPDEGMVSSSGTTGYDNTPYIGDYEIMNQTGMQYPTQFSPNRQVSSPVMFGSLPVGPDHPWQTLLFRPAALPGYHTGSASTSYTHPGNSSSSAVILPDHVLLDLFWMPIVEPYGVSEPLATSGKINLNYQIAPFTYITRKTGMEAVLKSVMITALSPAAGTDSDFSANYKNPLYANGSVYTYPSVTTRWPIDPVATLSQFDTRFAATLSSPYTSGTRNFFVSADEICDVPLVPLGYPGVSGTSDLGTFWNANSLTGDNSLERPYSMIYPRVTTKSNIFTVHVIAQSLKQTPSDLQSSTPTWTENVDQVTSEFHGAYTIEKYLDPDTADLSYHTGGGYQMWPNTNDGLINGSSASSQTVAIRNAKWRLLGVKRFGQ